jgi:hypothetical protein|tara:strand:+ start:671 stop:829 length:159 start_codon:yes stop_codon:yes gene_type:complete
VVENRKNGGKDKNQKSSEDNRAEKEGLYIIISILILFVIHALITQLILALYK